MRDESGSPMGRAVRHAISKTFTNKLKADEQRQLIARVIEDSSASLHDFVESDSATTQDKQAFAVINRFLDTLISPELE